VLENFKRIRDDVGALPRNWVECGNFDLMLNALIFYDLQLILVLMGEIPTSRVGISPRNPSAGLGCAAEVTQSALVHAPLAYCPPVWHVSCYRRNSTARDVKMLCRHP